MSFCGYISGKRKTKESMSLQVSWAGSLVMRNTGTDKVPDAILPLLFTGKVCSQASHVSMPHSKIWRRKVHTTEEVETRDYLGKINRREIH